MDSSTLRRYIQIYTRTFKYADLFTIIIHRPYNAIAMTPSEAQTVQDIGISLLIDVVTLTCLTFLYGTFTILASVALYIIRRNGLGTRSNLTMFLLTILMFALSTVYWGTFVAEVTREISDILIRNPAEPLDNKIQANGSWSFSVPDVIGILTSMTIYVVGDMIVVWRAWTLWNDNRKLMIVPMCLLASTLAVVITACGLRIRLAYGDVEVIDVIGTRMQQTSWALSLATNMVATSLIAYKAWKHQKSIRSNLGSLKRPTKIQKILALLVGSGLLYCILLITLIIGIYVNIPGTGGAAVDSIFMAVCVQLAAIYPTLVIVLVSLEKTVWNTTSVVVEGSRPTGIHFATVPEVTLAGGSQSEIFLAVVPDPRIDGKPDQVSMEETRLAV